MGWYEALDMEDKELVRMYTTARQFRNAILPSEYLQLVPGKTRNRIIPFVVNRSFSCELYLKMILRSQGKAYKKMHSITQLLEATALINDFTTYILDGTKRTGVQYSEAQLDADLQSISDAFINVRYVYEHESLTVSEGCLNLLNDYLDMYCRKIILDKLGVDMTQHTII